VAQAVPADPATSSASSGSTSGTSDFILNRDRVYNPKTEEVYHVNQNFYQYYDTLTGEQFRTHVPLEGNLPILPE
jgi:hypothetical protein